jgi:hypothetical protein
LLPREPSLYISMHAPRRLQTPIGFVVQPTNRSPLGFEAQTKKLS